MSSGISAQFILRRSWNILRQKLKGRHRPTTVPLGLVEQSVGVSVVAHIAGRSHIGGATALQHRSPMSGYLSEYKSPSERRIG